MTVTPSRPSIWIAPRNNSKRGTPYGFFRSNVWYGSEDKAQEFIKRLVDNINGYTGENAMEVSDVNAADGKNNIDDYKVRSA